MWTIRLRQKTTQSDKGAVIEYEHKSRRISRVRDNAGHRAG